MVAVARLPRRPNEYRKSATSSSNAAQTVVATAPCRMRSAAEPPSTARNPARFAQVTVAAVAAPAAPSHASNRTESHAGASGLVAKASRTRITSMMATVRYRP
jgi:hypothetical protein